jgi:hypothetical protein
MTWLIDLLVNMVGEVHSPFFAIGGVSEKQVESEGFMGTAFLEKGQ